MEWEVIPTLSFSIESSSTFTVPKGVKKIDVFCVGGGGAGGSYTPNVTNGGSSIVGDICTAAAGCSGNTPFGQNGGSGGGGSGSTNMFSDAPFYGGKGGSDGGSGGEGYGSSGSIGGGSGQGTTTRYFGESNGTLYSNGGDGGVCGASSPPTSIRGANTGDGLEGAGGFANGGGGGGGYTTTKLGVDVNPGQQISVTVGAGGTGKYSNPESAASGICIIRWGKR